jgi:hypothetical protein
MSTRVKTVLAALALLGCIAGGTYYLDNIKPPAVPPRQVVERYFEALRERDYKKAYSFVSLAHFNGSYNQFVDRVGMYSPDMGLEITGENIEKETAAVHVAVSLSLPFGPYRADSDMDLVRVKREWKIIHP